MSSVTEFANAFQSLTLLEKEYLRKLHDSKQEELTNQLVQEKEEKSYDQGTALKEFAKVLPFELTQKVNELYTNHVVQFTKKESENNQLSSENFHSFLAQLERNPELMHELNLENPPTLETGESERYRPYVKETPFKPSIHKVDVRSVQSNWLERYTELGNQQLDIVAGEQNYLERNLFTRIWNRRQIAENRKYLANLSTTVKDIEWQQSKYLHNSIEITAQSELERTLANQFTDKINAFYQSKIDQLTSSVTLANFESSTQQYNQIKSELFSLEQMRFNQNAAFPSFEKTVDQLHLLEVDLTKIDDNMTQYLTSVKEASNQGIAGLTDEQLSILESMSIESLERTNDILDQCMGDYVSSIDTFVKGFDTDGQLTESAIEQVKNYQIDAEYIENRQEQALLKEFDQFYVSCTDREKDYLHELNRANAEVRDNLDILEESDKSRVHKETLNNTFDDLTSDQIDSIRSAYNKYMNSSSKTLNQQTFHEYAKELDVMYDTEYTDTFAQPLDPLEQHFSQDDLNQAEVDFNQSAIEENDDKQALEPVKQQDQVLSTESDPHYVQQLLDQMEEQDTELIEDVATNDKKNESFLDFSDFEEEGYGLTENLEKAIYIFKDGTLWNGYSEGGNIRDIDHGVIEAFISDPTIDRRSPDFHSLKLNEVVQIVPETKTVLTLENTQYTKNQQDRLNEYASIGYNVVSLESTLAHDNQDQVLFHGSEQSFDKFALQRDHSSGATVLGYGIYLTDNKDRALQYANNKYLYEINARILDGRALSNVDITLTKEEMSSIIKNIAEAQIADEGYPYILSDFGEVSSETEMDDGNIMLTEDFADFLLQNDSDDLSVINGVYQMLGGDNGDSTFLNDALQKLDITHGVQEVTDKQGISSQEFVIFDPSQIDIIKKNDLSLESTRNHSQEKNEEIQSPLELAENELTMALEIGDVQKIAKARSKVNTAKLDQMMAQSVIVEKQQQQLAEENAQLEKEQFVELYTEYLTKGKLTNEQLREIVSLDEKFSDFDKVNLRLETVERLKGTHSEFSLDNHLSLLESVKGDSADIDDLIDSEYYHMSSNPLPINESNQQALSTVAENNFELIIE